MRRGLLCCVFTGRGLRGLRRRRAFEAQLEVASVAIVLLREVRRPDRSRRVRITGERGGDQQRRLEAIEAQLARRDHGLPVRAHASARRLGDDFEHVRPCDHFVVVGGGCGRRRARALGFVRLVRRRRPVRNAERHRAEQAHHRERRGETAAEHDPHQSARARARWIAGAIYVRQRAVLAERQARVGRVAAEAAVLGVVQRIAEHGQVAARVGGDFLERGARKVLRAVLRLAVQPRVVRAVEARRAIARVLARRALAVACAGPHGHRASGRVATRRAIGTALAFGSLGGTRREGCPTSRAIEPIAHVIGRTATIAHGTDLLTARAIGIGLARALRRAVGFVVRARRDRRGRRGGDLRAIGLRFCRGRRARRTCRSIGVAACGRAARRFDLVRNADAAQRGRAQLLHARRATGGRRARARGRRMARGRARTGGEDRHRLRHCFFDARA
jgi:hypothetical protein